MFDFKLVFLQLLFMQHCKRPVFLKYVYMKFILREINNDAPLEMVYAWDCLIFVKYFSKMDIFF
jgi:hypothetical protein